MKPKILIIGLAALFVAGCLSPASKINNVSIGMTKDEVIKAMGTPASVTADDKAEYLNYALSETGPQFGVPYVATPYEIKLVNGKVVSYGRAEVVNPPATVTQPVVVPVVR
jgi:hypothetical protein